MWQAQTMVRERERRRRGGQSCGIVSGRRMKNPVTVIRVDGEAIQKIWIRLPAVLYGRAEHLPQPFFFVNA